MNVLDLPMEANDAGFHTRGGVRVVLFCAVVVGLSACGEGIGPREIITDEQGCQWSARVYRWSDGQGKIEATHRILDADGKPMCGVK